MTLYICGQRRNAPLHRRSVEKYIDHIGGQWKQDPLHWWSVKKYSPNIHGQQKNASFHLCLKGVGGRCIHHSIQDRVYSVNSGSG